MSEYTRIFSMSVNTRVPHTGASDIPDNKVHGANMGPSWGRQSPGGPHAGPMNLAIWDRLWPTIELKLNLQRSYVFGKIVILCDSRDIVSCQRLCPWVLMHFVGGVVVGHSVQSSAWSALGRIYRQIDEIVIRLEGPEDPHLRKSRFRRSRNLARASIPLAQTPWGLTGVAWLQAGAQRVVIVILPPLNRYKDY